MWIETPYLPEIIQIYSSDIQAIEKMVALGTYHLM